MAKSRSTVGIYALASGVNRGKGIRMSTLNGSVRGPEVSNSDPPKPPDQIEESKTFRPGRPLKAIVRAVLRGG